MKTATHTAAWCAALLLAACQSGPGAHETGNGGIDAAPQHEWVLESGRANGKALDTAAGKVTLNTASKDAFTGVAAVNRYNAPVKIRGNSIEHTETITTTLMAGDMAAMRLESAYLEALGATKTIRRDGNTLTLSGDGIELHYRPGP